MTAAWDRHDGKLTERRRFDPHDSGNGSYADQGTATRALKHESRLLVVSRDRMV